MYPGRATPKPTCASLPLAAMNDGPVVLTQFVNVFDTNYAC